MNNKCGKVRIIIKDQRRNLKFVKKVILPIFDPGSALTDVESCRKSYQSNSGNSCSFCWCCCRCLCSRCCAFNPLHSFVGDNCSSAAFADFI